MKAQAWSAPLALALVTAAQSAAASSGIDSPDSGVVQSGRGSAWLARADDPLAVYFNPATLAFQASGVHVGAQLMFMNRCFSRQGDGGAPVSPGNNLPGPGAKPSNPNEIPPPAEVCSKPGAFPNPQVAATFRLADRFALGLGVVAPHASGSNSWPESVGYTNRFGAATTQPAPNRYLLVSSDAKILFPTVAVSFAPTENLSFGASFLWGVALIDFVNFSEGLSPRASATGTSDQYEKNSDLRAHLNGKDLFIPGFVLSAFWSATPNLDVSLWYKWTDAVRINSADLTVTSLYWQKSGEPNTSPCMGQPDAKCNLTDAKGVGTVKFALPMEAKLGVRYHYTRPGANAPDAKRPSWIGDGHRGRRVRDPLSEDLFDVEVDFTWANNSAVENLEVRFPTNPPIPVKGTPGTLPANADVPHHWKDVIGVRLGGDFVVLPSRLALRAGGFFETKGQSDDYLNLDFDVAQKGGVSGGATVRLGPVDVSGMYQHTFFGTLDNGGKGSIKALSGDQTSGFRSQQAINGGTLRASLNEAGLAGTVRW